MKHPVLLAFCFVVANVHAQGKADLLRSQNLFRAKCAACHSVACNRTGPKLEGLIGRRAGSVADFKYYTPELKNSGIVWSEEVIDKFINDPGKMVPGTSMAGIGRIESANERRDIIAHIRRQDRSIDLCL
jgi:cytochrome c